MRVVIELNPIKEGYLSYNYNNLLMSALHNITRDSEFDTHSNNKSNWTFYLDLSKAKFNKNNIFIKNSIYLILSGDDLIISYIVSKLEIIKLGSLYLKKDKVKKIDTEYNSDKQVAYLFKTLTPVILTKKVNNKEINIDNSDVIEYQNKLLASIKRKLSQFDLDSGVNDILVVADTLNKTKMVSIKDNVKQVGYYDFNFMLKGTEKSINKLIDMGIGKRNNYGFGFLEVIKTISLEN